MDATASQHPDRAIGGLNWSYVLMGVADATLLPFLPLYLFQRGLSAPQIGLVLAVAASASLVGGLGWAYLADHTFRPERIVVGASAAAAAVTLLFVLPASVAILAAVTVALAIARIFGLRLLADKIIYKFLRIRVLLIGVKKRIG